MERFEISKSVTEILPELLVVVVVCRNINNQTANPKVAEFAENAANSALASLTAYPNVQSHPRIALYRETLKKKLNVSAKKFPQSNESLLKRVVKKGAALPAINPLVDFYNAISIKHAVTAGAFDLAVLKARSAAPLELRRGIKGEDTFVALDSKSDAAPESVEEGELVYAQGNTVLTRHLAWRQAAQGLVTSETRDVVFVSEILECGKAGEEGMDLAKTVANDLVDGLKQFFGVDARAVVLGVERSQVEM